MLKMGGWWLKGGTLHRVVLFPRHLTPHCLSPGGGQGAGRVREAGEEGVESGRNRGKIRTIAQYFAIEKAERGGSQQI